MRALLHFRSRTCRAKALRVILASWLLALPAAAGTAPVVRSVAEFGVKGEGASVETALLQGAIDACAAGGGCVLTFPAGRYVSGTLYLRDNLTLRLDPGAVLATSGRADETTIRNPGSKLVSLVLLENATNVRVSGVRFLRSPAWTITLRVVDGAWIENVLIDNAMLAPHTSGLVIDSSTRVSVRGLHFRGGGDGITLQTSLVDGIAPPCSEITIADSTLRSGSMAMKIGTATHGDIRNVTVNGVVVELSQGGIGVFVRDGGTVENLQFSSLMLETAAVRRGRAEWPIVLDVKRRSEGGKAGQVRGVRFSNTQVKSSGKLLFSGIA